jgi:hypothetical protein
MSQPIEPRSARLTMLWIPVGLLGLVILMAAIGVLIGPDKKPGP